MLEDLQLKTWKFQYFRIFSLFKFIWPHWTLVAACEIYFLDQGLNWCHRITREVSVV